MKKVFLLALLSLLCISAVPAQTDAQLSILDQQIRPLYRKPTKEEIAAITKGIADGNFTYRNYAVPSENTTFALRLIAYRGKRIRTVQGKVYDELDFDKRKDLTVVFRVFRLEGANSVTILWKSLAEKDSPQLETEKED